MIHEQKSFYFIDTHCHIVHMIGKTATAAFSETEAQEIRKILHQADQAGVTHIIEVATTQTESVLAVELSKLYGNIFPVVGIHPHEASTYHPDDLRALHRLVATHHERIVGIGECGLDRHYPDHNLPAQQDLFKAQIELALTYDKALVVHTRDAQDETYTMLQEYKDQLKRVTIHCYSNDLQFAQAVTAWGWFLGIGGTVTYPKNSYLRDIVTALGLTSLVLETDAPFLPPQSMRGKPNTPDQVATIAAYLAQILDCTLHEVAQQTTHNAEKLFNLVAARR